MTYVVLAELQVMADDLEPFLALMRRHAALSLDEPGCRVFEVAQAADDARHIVLFEVYDDEAAYVAHRATPHYRRFREIGEPMLVRFDGEIFRRRSIMTRVESSTPDP